VSFRCTLFNQLTHERGTPSLGVPSHRTELGMPDLRTKTTILASAVAVAFCIAPLAHAHEATTLSITLKTALVNKPITISSAIRIPKPTSGLASE
jgi:hypothetical protein